MYPRALRKLPLLAALLGLSLSGAAQIANSQPGLHSMGMTISGAVRTVDNQPVNNARVEVRNTTGVVVASGYSTFNGSFEFQNVPPGSYDVVATSGLDQATEHAEGEMSAGFITLRLSSHASDAAANAGNHNTVSVAEMKVPNKAREEYEKAEKALHKQDQAAAAKHIAKALEICPDYAQPLTARALIELDQNQDKQAIADLERAVDLDRGYGLSFLVLGAAYNSMSRFDDAIRVLDHGVALSPNSWQGYFELSKAYLGKLNYQTALHQLDKAQQLAPKDYAPIHLVRANIDLALKAYPDAMSELEAYLERDPNGPQSERARKTLDQVKAFVAQK